MLLEISHDVFIPGDEDALRLARSLPIGTRLDVTYKAKSYLTHQQRKAIHVYCGIVAKKFNEAGIMRRIYIANVAIETSWSQESVKRDIWYSIQDAQFGTDSVNDLDRKGVGVVYETMNRDVITPHGIFVPFPKWEDLAK